jgi:hypothetical protein
VTPCTTCDLLDLDADDGQGNEEEEEEESDEPDYVALEDEDLATETTLLLPPKCHLHPLWAPSASKAKLIGPCQWLGLS